MSDCPRCQNPLPEGVALNRCPRCSARLGEPPGGAEGPGPGESQPPAPESVLSMPTEAPPTPSPSSRSTLVNIVPDRFPAGTLIAGRYRIVSLVGKGGMGEVYKAEDQVLGQVVAIKFLSDEYSRQGASLEHMLNEVRVARRVSHPNVCRVHDIAEHAGRRFISMEFIDGEDLSTLLRRIGRLPVEKALEVARQVCAGLAAAHDQRVLHRDLKPANIMLDAQGRARITDFGLAGVAEDIRQSKANAGTPAYMAPEQLSGESTATTATDIYTLGLVLYEMFTGKPVFRPKDLAELRELHRKAIRPPAELNEQLDPSLDRTIMQCLDRDASQRPHSVLAIAAALSNTDELAAALSAGITPSPRLLAAVGSRARLRGWRAWGLLAGFVLLLGVAIALAPASTLLPNAPLALSRDVLADRARTILDSLEIPRHRHAAYDFDYYEEYLSLVQAADPTPARWDRLRFARPSAIDFWYRESPYPLLTQGWDQRVDMRDPPTDLSDMVEVRLSPDGLLRELAVHPAPIDFSRGLPEVPASVQPAPVEPDWARLFGAAGLDLARFEPVAPERAPPAFADVRRAWVGTYPENASERIRVEAASRDARPTAFRIIEVRWALASVLDAPDPAKIDLRSYAILVTTNVAVLVGAVILAGRNLRQRRGDRSGAIRVAVFAAALALASFLLRADHVLGFVEESQVLLRAAQFSILVGALVWTLYIALEPYVRQVWPETLIAWSRVLAGRPFDPLVGSSVLVGQVAGVACFVLAQVEQIAPLWIQQPPGPHLARGETIPEALAGGRYTFGLFGTILLECLQYAMYFVLALLLLKLLCRGKTLAIILWSFVQAAIWSFQRGNSELAWVIFLTLGVIASLVAVRFGLPALIAGAFCFLTLLSFPLVIDPSHPLFGVSVVAVASLLGWALLATLVSGGWIGSPSSNQR